MNAKRTVKEIVSERLEQVDYPRRVRRQTLFDLVVSELGEGSTTLGSISTIKHKWVREHPWKKKTEFDLGSITVDLAVERGKLNKQNVFEFESAWLMFDQGKTRMTVQVSQADLEAFASQLEEWASQCVDLEKPPNLY